MALPLRALKQGELGRVVHHRELVEQRLDDFSRLRLGADVQVLGGVSGEVEGGAASQRPAGATLLLPRRARALARRRREGNGTKQLEVNFDETRVDPVFVLHQEK